MLTAYAMPPLCRHTVTMIFLILIRRRFIRRHDFQPYADDARGAYARALRRTDIARYAR